LVHRIVAEHGGSLTLQRLSPQGTVARLVFRHALAPVPELLVGSPPRD
jgi:hypothetical protein